MHALEPESANSRPSGAGGRRSRIAGAIALGIAMLSAAVTIASCGSGKSSPAVAQVGGASIDRTTVDHWASVIKRQSALGASVGRSTGTYRERALGFLISSDWLVGEAAARGLEVSDSEVERGLKDRIESVPNGRSEFQAELASTHQTIRDVELEVKATLAMEKLQEWLSRRVSDVSEAEVADYYRHNLRKFRVPDQRVVDLIEDLPSRAEATALGDRLGPGQRFTKKAIREIVPRQTPYEAAHSENHQLVHAIFAAEPGKVGGPASFNNHWVLLVVRKLVPGSVKPLASVKAEISKRLLDRRRQVTVTNYIASYRRKWTSRTTCRPGFIVQKCSEYRGRVEPEGNPLSSG